MNRPPVANRYALLFALLFPSVLTLAYFVLLAGTGIQQAAYAVGKAIQFSFPVIWVYWILGEPFKWSRWSWKGVPTGIGFGLLVMAAMLALYHIGLKPYGWFDEATVTIQEKVADMGLQTPWRYFALATFYPLAHSLIEEYYWRWFVFGQLRRQVSFGPATVISSLGFMAHHVILLATFFGWDSPLTYLGSFGVAIGGAFWAWLYERSGTLLGPWMSHLLIDAAIFIIGYDVVRDVL